MDLQQRDDFDEDFSTEFGRRLDNSNHEEADARDSRLPSEGDTQESLLWGCVPELASAEPAYLNRHDPRERGMLVSLHDTILENFPVLLRRLAKGDRASVTTDGPEDRSSQVCTEPISFPIPDPNTASQYASLQRAFIRFDIWGRDFDVASGLLEKKLEHSEDLREDIILVLLQLCDALYQSKCTLRVKTTNAHQRLTWNRSSSSHEERICHISNGAAEYSANSRNCQVLRWRG
jgi:hypothetical protein